MPANYTSKGLPEELFVAREAMEMGCNVSLPYGGKAKYDLLIERGGEVLKIQVKTASSVSSNKPLTLQIRGLNAYTESQVDFFAGVVNLSKIDADEEPSVDVPRHIFYKEFGEVDGKTARVNYRQPEDFQSDHNRQVANLTDEFNFNTKIDPRLPDTEN